MWSIILAAVIISIFLTAIEALILVTWAFDFCHVRRVTRRTLHSRT
jgi:hypothetical protein